jgi:acyl carrier protein
MDHPDIFDAIKAEALQVLDTDAALITPDAKLGETLDADSVDLIEIAGALERTFGVQIEDHEINDLVTVADFVELVARKRYMNR